MNRWYHLKLKKKKKKKTTNPNPTPLADFSPHPFSFSSPLLARHISFLLVSKKRMPVAKWPLGAGAWPGEFSHSADPHQVLSAEKKKSKGKGPDSRQPSVIVGGGEVKKWILSIVSVQEGSSDFRLTG